LSFLKLSLFGHLHGAAFYNLVPLACGTMFYWAEWKDLQLKVIADSAVKSAVLTAPQE
jgi:hypothetical protein